MCVGVIVGVTPGGSVAVDVAVGGGVSQATLCGSLMTSGCGVTEPLTNAMKPTGRKNALANVASTVPATLIVERAVRRFSAPVPRLRRRAPDRTSIRQPRMSLNEALSAEVLATEPTANLPCNVTLPTASTST